MIPQLLFLAFIGIGLRQSFLQRNQSEAHAKAFESNLLGNLIILALLLWGGFFTELILRIA